MKKILVSILALTLIVVMLSGCNNNKNKDSEQQITAPPKSQAPTPSTAPAQTETPAPEPTPIYTYDPESMAKNFITPEELESVVEGTSGGYDFTIPYDTEKWFQVDNKNIFVMKFEHIDTNFPWTITTNSNSFIVKTIRKSDYDYLVLKFIRANTETLIIFEAINEDGIVGSTLSDSPNGIYFAVANME